MRWFRWFCRLIIFIDSINKYLWDNDIQQKPIIYALDVVNFFPSVTLELALDAISSALKQRKLKQTEIKAVPEGFKILRGGAYFKWKSDFWQQIQGCPLGDVDSCSYTDIAMAHLLKSMVPAAEKHIKTDMNWFKIYRDDGLGITLQDPSIPVKIKEFFNNYDENIQWTITNCDCCNVPEVACPNYSSLIYLDTKISWQQVKKDDIFIWQFSTSVHSKKTDVHAYIHPQSCSAPHLNESGVSIAKTVGVRLRTIHSNDNELLQS